MITVRPYTPGDLPPCGKSGTKSCAAAWRSRSARNWTARPPQHFFFAQSRTSVAWRTGMCWGCIFSIPITSGAAVTSPTRATPSPPPRADAAWVSCSSATRLRQARRWGFAFLQFNAVVRTNEAAIRLYEKVGIRASRRHTGRVRHGRRPLRGHHPHVPYAVKAKSGGKVAPPVSGQTLQCSRYADRKQVCICRRGALACYCRLRVIRGSSRLKEYGIKQNPLCNTLQPRNAHKKHFFHVR